MIIVTLCPKGPTQAGVQAEHGEYQTTTLRHSCWSAAAHPPRGGQVYLYTGHSYCNQRKTGTGRTCGAREGQVGSAAAHPARRGHIQDSH